MLEEEVLREVGGLMARLGLFALSALIAPYAGRWFPQLILRLFRLSKWYVEGEEDSQDQVNLPFQNLLNLIFTFAFLAAWLNLLIPYEELYTFLGSIIYLALSISIILFATRIARRIIRSFVIVLVQRWFGEVNEVVLVFETLVYVLIVVSATLIFAIGLRVNLLAVISRPSVVYLVPWSYISIGPTPLENISGSTLTPMQRMSTDGWRRLGYDPPSSGSWLRIRS